MNIRHHLPPLVGAWYKDREYNSTFEVVAMDEYDHNVEIQHFSGEIEEIDLDIWYELDIHSIPAPEDWSGPYEMAHEDLDYYHDTHQPDYHSNPLNEIEPDDSHTQ